MCTVDVKQQCNATTGLHVCSSEFVLNPFLDPFFSNDNQFVVFVALPDCAVSLFQGSMEPVILCCLCTSVVFVHILYLIISLLVSGSSLN